MDEFIEDYRNRTDRELFNSVGPLSGDKSPIAQKRLKAVRQVMEERGLTESQEQEPVKEPEPPKTLDERTAEKYLAKKRNAQGRGIGFELTLGQVRKLMSRKRCRYTGVTLLDECDQWNPCKRTLDRIDSSKGYTANNTVACSLAANSLKNAVFEDPKSPCRMSAAEFRKFAKAVGENQ